MSFPSVSGLSFQDPSTQFNNTGFDNQMPFGNGSPNGSGGGDPISQLLQAIIPLLQMAAQMLGGQGGQNGGTPGGTPGGGSPVGGPGGTPNPSGGSPSDPMSGLFNSFGQLFQAIAPMLQALGGGGGGMQPTADSSSLASQFPQS